MVSIYADGGCRMQGTPQAECYGSVRVIGKADTTLRYQFHDINTNNAAEYHALLKALGVIDLATQNTTWRGSITIYMDSALVINQVLGVWKCKATHLQPKCALARKWLSDLIAAGLDIQLVWAPDTVLKAKLGH